MSYCIRCGRQTDNEDFVCDDCRRKDGFVPDPAVQGAALPGQAGTEAKPGAEQPPSGSPSAAREENAPPPTDCGQWQPRANAGPPPYIYGDRGYGSYGAPWQAPYFVPPAPADRSKLPLNKCGVIGMIFSLAALLFFILMFVIVVAVVMQNPQWFENPFYEPTEEEIMLLGGSVFFPLLFSFLCAVTGTVLSAVGLARYRRFRAVGFAIAGLVIGVVMLLSLFSMFTGV